MRISVLKLIAATIIMLPLATTAIAEPKTCHTLAEFEGFDRCSSIPDLLSKVGKPWQDIGSGIHILSFPLCDGTTTILGTPDMKSIFYVKQRDQNGKTIKEIIPGPVMYKRVCPESGVTKQQKNNTSGES